jgi:hypothetical protein
MESKQSKSKVKNMRKVLLTVWPSTGGKPIKQRLDIATAHCLLNEAQAMGHNALIIEGKKRKQAEGWHHTLSF